LYHRAGALEKYRAILRAALDLGEDAVGIIFGPKVARSCSLLMQLAGVSSRVGNQSHFKQKSYNNQVVCVSILTRCTSMVIDETGEKFGSMLERNAAAMFPRAREGLFLVHIAVQSQDHLTLGRFWSRDGSWDRSFLNELSEKHESLIL